MDIQEIQDWVYYEFDQEDVESMPYQDRIMAYERLKFKLQQELLTPDEYTSSIIKISEYLEI